MQKIHEDTMQFQDSAHKTSNILFTITAEKMCLREMIVAAVASLVSEADNWFGGRYVKCSDDVQFCCHSVLLLS